MRECNLSKKDRSFLDHLYEQFEPLGIVGTPPKELKSIIQPSGNTRVSYYFATLVVPYFTDLHKQWYRNVDGKNGSFQYCLSPYSESYCLLAKWRRELL